MRLINADALKDKIPYLWSDPTDISMLLDLIDNAPTVEQRDNFDLGYIQGLEDGKKERPQDEFTDLEREVTADAINYLLGAELLEENGYTEEVINALKSALQKLGAEEDHL